MLAKISRSEVSGGHSAPCPPTPLVTPLILAQPFHPPRQCFLQLTFKLVEKEDHKWKVKEERSWFSFFFFFFFFFCFSFVSETENVKQN